MAGKALKIIFIIFIIVLIIGAVYISLAPKNQAPQNIENAVADTNSKQYITDDSIRIGIIEFDNMNPILSNNKNVQDISRLIFDPLFTLTEDYQLKPSLATECSQLDKKTYLIKLREDVKWQDGNSFDVEDVIFTIDMLKKAENHSVYAYNVADIATVDEIDEYTLKITTSKESPYFAYNLIFPVVSHHFFNEQNFRAESKNLKPVGTGRFYISDVNEHIILLKKSTNGWDNEEMKLDTISLCLYDSLSSAINAFKMGEIDLFTTSNIRIEEYLKNTSYNKKEYINRNYTYLALNCTQKVLANKEVRQAINSAINKEEIVKSIYNGQYQVSNFPLDFGSYVYNPNNISISYNPNTAKRLLLDQNWKYSSKKWRKTVKSRYLTIELKLVVEKANNSLVKVANKIKKQLESIGMRITVIEATQKQYNSYMKNKNYDMILVDSNYGYSPSLDKYFKESNLANYKNEEITKILEESKQITDNNQLKEKNSRVTEIYHDEVPYISLFYNTNYLIYSPNLKGEIHPNSYNLFYGINDWYREYKVEK